MRLRKILLISVGAVVGLVLLLVLVLSPLAKRLIEKNDVKWIGREVSLSSVYVNPFTGTLHLNDVVIYENRSDSVFISAEQLRLGFRLYKMLFGDYEISYLGLDKPVVTITQVSKGKFNFSDISEHFSKDKEKDKDSSEVHFNLLNVKVEGGTLFMNDKLMPVHYSLKNISIRSTGMRWDTDTVNAIFDFDSGLGSGKFEGNFTVDKKTLLYKTHVIIRRLDLQIIEQYLKDLASYGTFSALINLDITATGDLRNARNIDAVGGVGIYDFHFGKNRKEDLASFKKFVMKIDHLNPAKKIYVIDSISLVTPFLRYEKYDHLDNIQKIFGEKGSNVKEAARSGKFNIVIEIANYIRLLATNFFHSDYKINRIGIYRANLQYHDYSLNEKFAIALNPLTIKADSLNSKSRRARFRLHSGIKPYGELQMSLSINPRDSSDFELNYTLEKVNAAVLNPFLLAYTSFPLDRGSIELKGNWRVLNGAISSNNHLLVIDPRITRRNRANDNKWLPLRFFMFFVRERGNAIDYQIPITGNIKDARFHLRDVATDVLTNVFVKPATTRYRVEIKELEKTIEQSIGFNWERGSSELLGDQEDFLERVAAFLGENEAARISVFPVYDEEKEKEHIAFFEAKKKYYTETQKSRRESKDSVRILRMSVKDPAFERYMRERLKDEMMYTSQQLCRAFAGSELIKRKYEALNRKREEVFMQYFREAGVADRVSMEKAVSRVPFNGFSYFEISYKGTIPESLKEAFRELSEYDNEKPRSKLQKERKKTRRFFNFRRGKKNPEADSL